MDLDLDFYIFEAHSFQGFDTKAPYMSSSLLSHAHKHPDLWGSQVCFRGAMAFAAAAVHH